MAVKDNPITVAIATLALVVGLLSAGGGVLVERTANHKVCQAKIDNNAAVRGLLDDFLSANKATTPAQRARADALTKARFPVKPC